VKDRRVAELACNPGETLASVTCPQGTVSITKKGKAESASCANGAGPALALWVRSLKAPSYDTNAAVRAPYESRGRTKPK
jgi:hypothetical protein